MRKTPLTLCFITLLSIPATGQSQTFTKDGLEYALDLPSPLWKAVSRLDVHEHFKFVNGDDYSNGYLRLRKKFVTAGSRPENLFSEDEKWELQRLPGYIACRNGKGADFNSRLRGRVFSYEYVDQDEHGRSHLLSSIR
jgi:hypothetical protein